MPSGPTSIGPRTVRLLSLGACVLSRLSLLTFILLLPIRDNVVEAKREAKKTGSGNKPEPKSMMCLGNGMYLINLMAYQQEQH